MPESAETVAAALGHRFERPTLLEEALTHRSFRNERPDVAPRDNERLEFLGDAVLDLVVSELLWRSYPQAPEGELTRRRADLVCEPTLSALASDVAIGPALRLGRGEERSGGRDKPRLLASALEACMGAVYLDGGFPAAFEVGRRLLSGRLDAVPPGASDYKSRLQELTQRQGEGTPSYELVRTEGPDHDRRFHVVVSLSGRLLAWAEGRSKLEAEQAAARDALHALQEVTPDETV
ncbi:MAG: ribonuclease III [Myxococcota bacterium]